MLRTAGLALGQQSVRRICNATKVTLSWHLFAKLCANCSRPQKHHRAAERTHCLTMIAVIILFRRRLTLFGADWTPSEGQATYSARTR